MYFSASFSINFNRSKIISVLKNGTGIFISTSCMYDHVKSKDKCPVKFHIPVQTLEIWLIMLLLKFIKLLLIEAKKAKMCIHEKR